MTPSPRAPRPRDTDPPLAWAEYYLSLGFALCHLAPGVKKPVADAWNTPGQWIDTPAKAAAQWGRTPTHGMGLVHAGSGTVAIDIDAIDETRRVFREYGLDLDRLLSGAPRIRGKRSGRDKAIFRAPDGVELARRAVAWHHPDDAALNVTLFEFRAGAVHDVLPPSQHPDGHRYEWVLPPWDLAAIPTLPRDLLDFWRELPTLRTQIAALAPWGRPVEVPAPRYNFAPSEGHNDVIGAFNRAHSVDALLRANGYERRGARYLAPSSTTRIPGVSALPDGRVYSHHGSDPLNDGRAHDAFDLFTHFQHGGDAKAALRAASELLGVPVYGSPVPAMDFSELLASITTRAAGSGRHAAEPAAPPTFPAHLLECPGLIGGIAAYINATARYPQPILALAAAIAAAATFMGRKVRTESDLRTNVYVLAVAEAGAGKEHNRQAVRQVFDHVGAFPRVAVEQVASESGLVTALVAVPSSLFLLDEVGRLLEVLQDKRAGSHLSEIITQLLKLHSGANGPYCGKVYADSTKNQIVQHPNLSIYGTTVPGVFHSSLSASQVEDGFLSRLMVFESEDPDPEPRDVAAEPPPHALVEACAAWERTPENAGAEAGAGNVAAITRPHPITVPPDAEARVILSRFEAEMRERRQRLRAANQNAGLYVRTAANAQKLALIRAAGIAGPDRPVITADDANWGCALALHLADSMAYRILTHVAENATERAVKKVGGLIRGAGARGITKSDLIRKTQWLRSNERNDVLVTLVQSDEVVMVRAGKTKPVERFFWHAWAPDAGDSSNPSTPDVEESSESNA